MSRSTAMVAEEDGTPRNHPAMPRPWDTALKKSFEAEDAGDAPGSPIASPLPVGATESHRALQPSPTPHSPLLRGQHRAGRAPGGIASFQSHAGPGSDGESLRSSSSSLESPAAPQLPAASLAADSCLKKVPSHGCVFPVEAECSLHVAAGHSSLPALDLHIAEEPGIPPPAPCPTPPWGARSPTAPPHTRLPSSSSSAEVAPGLPRTQLRVSLSASPRLARPTPPTATAATGPGEGLLPPAAPFKLVSQPQTVQVSSQPAFLGGMVLGPGTPLALRNMGSTGPTMGTCLVTPRGLSQAADGCCATATPEHGSSLEPQERSMEAAAVPQELPPDRGAHELFGYVGIEAVLEQMKVKTMKMGFEFNIMVVGQSGLGKSTMVNTLFKSKVSRKASQPSQEERIPKTVQLQSVTHVIEEKGVKMKLTVTDTPGFGDQINNENCWDPIIKYINEQYERYLREEILITRKRKIPDSRVHGCVYFIPPTGHWLRPLDLEFMRRLSKIVNVVPVIAKADTLTLEEREEFKQRIQQDLKAHSISVYPQEDFDEDPDDRLLNDRIREKIPFAVVGADQEHQVNGKRVLGRKTKWGIIEVENPEHCEFPMLRDLLIRSHLQDLKDITHNVHYESYRVRRLNESNRPAPSSNNGLPGRDEDGEESNL
uniref:Septin 12 n=2 Tax=Gallus gallus TaxID=9031 RepID=A0A8V0ZC31_CHICK